MDYDYKELKPFKWFVIQNFPFIDADFDAITNYQLFCKLGEEINKIINSENTLGLQVENLTNAYNTLKAYVDNYFDNLDVQEEINNKLDEMAEDGTLEEIITTYLNISAMLIFDTMQDMINSERLINGSTCEILGYYAKNDGGKGIFKIRNVTNQDVTNNYNLIALSNENLVAELIEKEKINIRQCAAKGDGITDDTIAIQNAFDNYKNIYIPVGTYMINAITSVKPKSNSIINFDKNAKFKAITNSANNYKIIDINNVSNVVINYGIIEGDKDTHTGSTGEWGHAIGITGNSENITINETICQKAWGDGIYINGAKNVKTNHVICDNNRRQGISVISVDSYYSLNDILKNTQGTKPQAGMDIEPNYNTDILKNIVIENLTTKDNYGDGLEIYLMQESDNTNEIDITVINHTDLSSNRGISVSKHPNTKGFIRLIDCIYKDNNSNGINCRKCYDSDLLVEFIRPKVINANSQSESGTDGKTAFQMTESETGFDEYPFGNVSLIEPYFDQSLNIGEGYNVPNIYVRNVSHSSVGINNFKLINPIYLSNKNVWLANVTNCYYTDNYRITETDDDEDITISDSRTKKYYSNSTYTEDRTITVPNTLVQNVDFIFEGKKAAYPLQILMHNNSYVFGISNSQVLKAKITLQKGCILKMRRINQYDYYCECNNLNLITVTPQT